MRTKAFLWTLLGCLVAPPIATAQDVYFSMGNEIRKLTLPATAADRRAHQYVCRWAIWLFALVIPTSSDAWPSVSLLRRARLQGADRISRLDVKAVPRARPSSSSPGSAPSAKSD